MLISVSEHVSLARNFRFLCDQSRQLPTFELFTLFNTVYAVSYFHIIENDVSRVYVLRPNKVRVGCLLFYKTQSKHGKYFPFPNF